MWSFIESERDQEELSTNAEFWGYNFKGWGGSSQSEGILILEGPDGKSDSRMVSFSSRERSGSTSGRGDRCHFLSSSALIRRFKAATSLTRSEYFEVATSNFLVADFAS